MVERNRFDNGTFAPKSSQVREVRSLRLTDETWRVLGETAELKGITRADLIEELAVNGVIEQRVSSCDEIDELRRKVLELATEKEDLTKQLSAVREGLGVSEIQELKDKVLGGLGMGEQSKPYRNAAKVFRKFMQTHFST